MDPTIGMSIQRLKSNSVLTHNVEEFEGDTFDTLSSHIDIVTLEIDCISKRSPPQFN